MNKRTTVFWRYLVLAVWTGSAAIAETPLQPLDSIVEIASKASKARAMEQGYEGVTVSVRALDKRLRLPLCEEPLEALDARSSAVLGPLSTGVRCSGDTPWTIYVRVEVTAVKSVPVLARALPRHARIQAKDLKIVERPLASVPKGILYDAAHIIGMELNRPLDEGATIRASQLRAPKVVKRGDQVTVLSGTAGLTVRSQGKAMEDAIAGERVSVINSVTGVKVEGVAGTDGTVTVP